MRSSDKARAARHRAIVTAPLEGQFRSAYRRVMRRLRADVTTKRGSEPFDLAHWRAETFRALTPIYRESLVRGAADILGLRGIKTAVRHKGLKVDKARKGELERVFEDRVNGFVETTYDALEDLLDEAQEDDLDDDEIGDLVDEEFRDVLGPGADLIAATEVGAAVGSARDYVMRQVVDLHRWVNAGDERVRESHVVYGDAEPVPVGFNFASLMDEEYELKYPVDPACDEAGEVIHCRCFSIPEGDVEMDPSDLSDFLGEFGMDVEDLTAKGFVEVRPMLKDFSEEAHPRAQDGKFTDGGGETPTTEAPAPREPHPHATDARVMARGWVADSNSRVGVAAKMALKKEFGLAGSIYDPDKAGPRVDAKLAERSARGVRALYEETQAALAAKGVGETITLYRGIDKPRARRNVAESWTTDKSVAASFGKHVMAQTFNRSQILAFQGGPFWSNQYKGESEFVIMPGMK